MKIEKFFYVIACFDEQKASYAAFMLDNEAEHWWRMTRRLLEAHAHYLEKIQGCFLH